MQSSSQGCVCGCMRVESPTWLPYLSKSVTRMPACVFSTGSSGSGGNSRTSLPLLGCGAAGATANETGDPVISCPWTARPVRTEGQVSAGTGTREKRRTWRGAPMESPHVWTPHGLSRSWRLTESCAEEGPLDGTGWEAHARRSQQRVGA